MDKKKSIIIISVVLIICLLIVFLVSSLSSNNYSHYYLVLDNEIIKYEDESYTKVDPSDMDKESFKILSLKTYLGNFFYDHYDYDSSNIFFMKEDKSYLFDKPLLGLQDNAEYINYEKINLEEEELLSFIPTFDKVNIDNTSFFTEASKVEIDLDNNGEIDYIYNFLYEGEDESDDFSTIIVEINGNRSILDEDIPKEVDNIYEITKMSLEYILDLDNDKNYELIFTKTTSDNPEYSIYKLDDTYKEVYYTHMEVQND